MLYRYSSRRVSLYEEFLKKRLTGARRYHRIAGYFQSSLLELAAEELAAIPEVRILCNTEVNPGDLQTVRMATGSRRRELEQGLLRLAWNAGRFTHLVDVHGHAAQEPGKLVLDDVPFEKGQRVEVLLLAPDHEETDRMKRLKALFKETQALPQMQTVTEEEIAAEIARYRSGQ